MDQVPPPPPAEPTRKKGLHPLAWVGIGCGGLLVVAIIGISIAVGFFKRKVDELQESMASGPHRTAAEMMVKINPDLEMVADDEAAGEMTVRVKSSGEEITVSYDDLANGRLKVRDGKGAVTSIGAGDESQVPAWVPRYPNIASQASVLHRDRPDGSQGVWVFTTGDAPEQVEEFFSTGISWSNSSSGGSTVMGQTTQLDHSYSGDGREVKLTASSQGSGKPTQVTVTYEESKP